MKSNNNDEPDFRTFLSLLKSDHEIIHITKDVSTQFELAAVTAKMDGKQALLFDKVQGAKMTVASNVCGTPKRFHLAISGTSIEPVQVTSIKHAIHSRITKILGGLSDPKITHEIPLFMRNSSKNLSELPIITHFEKDAGPFITSAIVFAKDQEKGNQNSSTHRLLYLDDQHMAIRMVEGRHLHKCFTYARDHGDDLKIAITIGVHPAINIAAAYQAAYGIDEMKIANALLDGKLVLSRTDYSGLYIPKHAEIVLEGRILRDRTHEEWMVEMLRTYDYKRKQPVFELERIYFRDAAIYQDILPGYTEHRLLMGLPVEAKMYDYVKSIVPTTQSLHLTNGGSNWLAAVIQIKKQLEGEPKNALLAAFAAHPSLKIATVVDDDIDPTDPIAVEYALTTRCQADKSFIIISNAKGSSLDPSSDQINLLTTKVGIDATATILKPKERFEIAKIPGEEKIKIQDYV